MKSRLLNLKVPYVIPSVLFIFSFLLRISLISKGPYHSDCLYLALQSQKILTTHHLQYLHGLGFPLTALMGAGFIWLLKPLAINDPVLAVNFMNVFFGSLSVVILYLCVTQLLDKTTALFSSLILSLNPLFLALSTFGNTHILSIFFFLTALYSLFSYLKNPYRFKLFLSGILFGLSGAARLQDLLVMIIPLLFLLIFPPAHMKTSEKNTRTIQTLFSELFLLSSFCLITLCLFYLPSWTHSPSPSLTSSFSDSITRHFLKYLNPLALSSLSEPFFSFFSAFSPAEWLGITLGFIYLFRKDAKLLIFLALWVACFFLSFGNLIFAINRHFALALTPTIVIESYFLSHISKQKNFLRLGIPFVFIIFLLLNLMRFYPIMHFRHNYALLPDFFTWAGQETEPNAYIIERDHSLFIHYYAKRAPLAPEIKLYAQGYPVLEEFKTKLDTLLDQDIPVYITKYGILYRPKHKFREFMVQHYAFDYIGSKTVEDWHKGCLKQILVKNDLLRIRKLEPSSPPVND